MNQPNEKEFNAETEVICDELESLLKRPRTVLVERRIKQLLKKSGYPEYAKTMFRRR